MKDAYMNRSRWISLGFVILFMAVAIGVPAWKEHTGQVSHKYTDGLYAAFVLLCMGLFCIWFGDTASRDTAADESGDKPQATGDRRRSVKSVGWLLLVLSIVIASADLIR
jgi:hypothetical protein